MAIIKPFKALRPRTGLENQVASRPYDVLNSREAREEAAGNPYSFYHISKAEIDLPEDVDVHDGSVYQKAAENLKRFQQEKILVREAAPCYYIYRLEMHGKVQTGLSCVSSVHDYEHDRIKKHELTRPEKEQDRINHIATTGAQTGNVFLAYHAVDETDELIARWQEVYQPVYDFGTADGVHHSVWIINDAEEIARLTSLFALKVPATYIADGHHRAASAAKVVHALTGPEAEPGSDAWFFLTTLFPDNQLHIFDYNRVVKDLNGFSVKEFLSALDYAFTVSCTEKTAVKPAAPHEFGMYLEGKWYELVSRAGTYDTDPIGILDVTILQKNVLDTLLGIKDPRTDNRIDFVGGIRGTDELQKRVDSKEMQVAFTVFPVTMDQLFEIADTGQIMPPKSTWFEPKLRDGLLTHLIRDTD